MSKFRGFPGGLTWDQAILEAARDEANGIPPRRFAQYLIGGAFDTLTTTMVDVQPEGGITDLPTAAGPVTLVSSDPGDNITGAGAQVVLVRGVGAGYVGGPSLWLDELVFMNGATNVVTLQDYLRVFSMRVVVAGSHLANLGNIDASIGAFGIQARIGFDGVSGSNSGRGTGVTTSSKFAVPTGWTAHIRGIHVSWGENQSILAWAFGSLGGVESSGLIASLSDSDQYDVGILPLPAGLTLIGRAARKAGSGGHVGITAPVLLVRVGA